MPGWGDGDGDWMKNSIFRKGARGCVTTYPPFIDSNTANSSPFPGGPFIVASTRSRVERLKINQRPGSGKIGARKGNMRVRMPGPPGAPSIQINIPAIYHNA